MGFIGYSQSKKKKLTGRPYSRFELFIEDEAKLRPLPQERFENQIPILCYSYAKWSCIIESRQELLQCSIPICEGKKVKLFIY